MSFLPRLLLSARPLSLSSSLAGPSRLPLLRSSPLPILRQQPRTPKPTSLSLSLFSTSAPTSVKQKLKSHSGSKKRFFPNASGMFKRAQTGKAHLNTPFSTARINRLAKAVYVTKTQAKKIRKMLPYA